MERFALFSGLAGLEAKEIFKRSKETLVKIPLENTLRAHDIGAEETLYFTLTSKEVWLKVLLQLDSTDEFFNGSMEIKVNLSMNMKEIKDMLCRLAIMLWNTISQKDSANQKMIYLLQSFEVKEIVNAQGVFTAEDFESKR